MSDSMMLSSRVPRGSRGCADSDDDVDADPDDPDADDDNFSDDDGDAMVDDLQAVFEEAPIHQN